jgi:hypothetical protein
MDGMNGMLALNGMHAMHAAPHSPHSPTMSMHPHQMAFPHVQVGPREHLTGRGVGGVLGNFVSSPHTSAFTLTPHRCSPHRRT